MLIRSITLLISMLAVTQAFAGGDDYDAANDVKGDGPAYFGFVRDTRGSLVADAQVVLQPKTGKPVTLKSYVTGLYTATSTSRFCPTTCKFPASRPATSRRKSSAARPQVTTSCSLRPNARCSAYKV